MLSIPTPPQPQLPALAAWSLAGGCIIVGALLLLWGRVLSRPFLAMSGAAAGVLLAESLGRQLGIATTVAGVIGIVGLAVAGALAARLVWAMACGGLLAAIAVCVLLWHSLSALPAASQPTFGASGELGQWFQQCWRFVHEGLQQIWGDNSASVLWTLCLAGGVPLTALLLLPRLGKIFMTALTGAVGIVIGLLLALGRLSNAAWPSRWRTYLVYVVISLVLVVFSVVWQYSAAIAAQRAEKQRQEMEKKAAAAVGKRQPPKFAPDGSRRR